MIRILIAEDHKSLIGGLQLFFNLEEDITVVETTNSGREALEKLKYKHVDIVVTDIRMPDIDGIDLTKRISKEYPHIKVIAFSMFEQPEALLNMLKAGAKGYLTKNLELDHLREAIYSVYEGGRYFDPNLSFALNDESFKSSKRKGVLTKRQQEILELIRQRKSNAEIGDILCIGKHTVATHRRNMIQKLNLSGPNALLLYAQEKRYNFE
jgi:two-component system nitrate/nitrite response regulator NarL